jgi:arylformamidase
MRTIEISFPIEEGMPAFPGDPPVTIRKSRSIDWGDPYELSVLSMGSHTGTHVDPPVHFLPGGATVDQIDLSTLNGPCYVLHVPDGTGTVGAAEIDRLPEGADRVLLRTRNSPRWESSDAYFPEYVALDIEGARRLVARGVRLVGVDALSIDGPSAREFPVHRALLGAGVVVLEGLRLAGAREGAYELRCLPLRISGGDGGPCRAVLVEP